MFCQHTTIATDKLWYVVGFIFSRVSNFRHVMLIKKAATTVQVSCHEVYMVLRPHTCESTDNVVKINNFALRRQIGSSREVRPIPAPAFSTGSEVLEWFMGGEGDHILSESKRVRMFFLDYQQTNSRYKTAFTLRFM